MPFCLPRYWRFIFVSTAALLTSGCAWFDASEQEPITGKYFVMWNDLPSNRAIVRSLDSCEGCYEIVIDDYVFAVGNNPHYIIAKSHFGSDTIRTNYHIINLVKHRKHKGQTGVYSNLSQATFDSLRSIWKIENISFDKLYPELPSD